MQVKQLGPNKTIVKAFGEEFFFSYETCVGMCRGTTKMVIEETISVTTSRHINEWLGQWDLRKSDKQVQKLPESEFAGLFALASHQH